MEIRQGDAIHHYSMCWYLYPLESVKCDLLFGGDVALTYGGAIHFGHLHITLDLPELQSQVLATDGHQCAALPGTPEGGDLLKFVLNSISQSQLCFDFTVIAVSFDSSVASLIVGRSNIHQRFTHTVMSWPH